MNATRRDLLLGCALYALSLSLYLPGYGRLLPYDPEPDNYVVVQVEQLDAALPAHERLDKFKSYPLLTADLARALPERSRAVLAADDDARLRESLRAASDSSLRVRLVVALLSALLAPLTYCLARRFLDRGPAFGAALLSATSLLVGLFANQARPHGAHAALSLLGVLGALAVLEKPSWRRYLLAGLGCAVAVATLQTGWFTLVTLGVAHVHVQRSARRGARAVARRAYAARHLPFAAAVAVVVVVAWCFAPSGPYVARSAGVQGSQLHLGSHVVELGSWNGRGWAQLAETLASYEPVLAALAGAALLVHARSIRRWNADPLACVVASHPLMYVGFWGFYGLTYERYWLPLVPYLAILAAWVVTRPAAHLVSMRARVARLGLWALVLALPTWLCVRLAWLRTRESTVELAARWLESNVDAASARIAVTPQLNVPLWYAERALDQPVVPKTAGSWVRFQRAHPPPDGAARYELVNLPFDIAAAPPGIDAELYEPWLARLAPTHVLLEVSQWTKLFPTALALRAHARGQGELVYATPDEREAESGRRTSLYQSTHAPIERILGLDRLGPRMEIWRLR